ncbi:hypothetical protein, variant 5 [Verruconis gallopava]|uniref:Uncharacterized protein n=1 Tax=Verruconis gallopava TaxID=253628 RepID=A0A0D2ADX1_9PEZI|nr:hypothetical protein, variant 4 [Verruconis gallopava]XP_016214529.1 hypothetical protein, variant 5 [Verruconis gallopava]KIW04659.1 hypothetical protein, variant 4 [Verruconis gallopava]KIW04660.1 hypothetical protein, variant 5 [Verruconis gallopava]
MSRAIAKSAQAEKPAFVFIDESAKSTKDKRRQIRSQAKRFAIAERSKRPREIRFVNIKGSKEDQHRTEQGGSNPAEPDKTNGKNSSATPRRSVIIPDLPKRDYEAARIEHGFDVFLLSGLASVHIGKGASLHLYEAKLGDWLKGFREPSYLDFVPAYYGSSELVRSTVNCTMAQYKREMCPSSGVSEATVFKLYGIALKDLQMALNDVERRLQPDILLATAVLQLFELLQNETSGRWSYHTLGLMHLLQMRDPATYSELEMSLLASQFGPLVNECFLRQIDCFLEDPKWEGIILLLQRQNRFVTSMLSAQTKLPRYIRIAKEHIMGNGPCDAVEKLRVLEEMHSVKEFSYRWEEELREQAKRDDTILNLHELPCALWSLQLNLNRLMVSLDPWADDAQILEQETQELSERIMAWWDSSSRIDGEREDRFYTFPIPSAQICLATRFEWQCVVEGRPGYVDNQRGVVHRKIFENMVTLIKSKPPTRKYKYVKSP